MPSRMDGSKPPDWSGFPPDQGIPEITNSSDDESIWGLTDQNQHSPEFIHNELNWRQRLEDYRSLEANTERNAQRLAAIDVVLSRIETLIDIGNDAENSGNVWYDWSQHESDMEWYENELRQLEAAAVASARNQRADERQLLRNWLPFNHPDRQRRRRQRRRRRDERMGTGFERY